MNCRSAYHNVPIINGLEQKDGRKYRAEKVSHVFSEGISSLTLNLEKAYTEAAHVEKYDAQYLSASVEKVQMTDGIMKTQWKDNIYRIILRLNDNYPMAKVKYRFVETR